MSKTDEKDNMAVLSVMGALIDELADAGLLRRDRLATRIAHAAAVHDEAGQPEVADKVRWLTRALVDEELLDRLSRTEGSNRH